MHFSPALDSDSKTSTNLFSPDSVSTLYITNSSPSGENHIQDISSTTSSVSSSSGVTTAVGTATPLTRPSSTSSLPEASPSSSTNTSTSLTAHQLQLAQEQTRAVTSTTTSSSTRSSGATTTSTSSVVSRFSAFAQEVTPAGSTKTVTVYSTITGPTVYLTITTGPTVTVHPIAPPATIYVTVATSNANRDSAAVLVQKALQAAAQSITDSLLEAITAINCRIVPFLDRAACVETSNER